MRDALFWLALASGIVIFLVSVANESDKKQKSDTLSLAAVTPKTETPEKEIYENNARQLVTTVLYEDFNKWLSVNNDKRIISICSIDQGDHGKTSGFMIVYTR